jgi:hypothetical protein
VRGVFVLRDQQTPVRSFVRTAGVSCIDPAHKAPVKQGRLCRAGQAGQESRASRQQGPAAQSAYKGHSPSACSTPARSGGRGPCTGGSPDPDKRKPTAERDARSHRARGESESPHRLRKRRRSQTHSPLLGLSSLPNKGCVYFLRLCLDEKVGVKSYCSTFRCYLVKFVQPWIN